MPIDFQRQARNQAHGVRADELAHAALSSAGRARQEALTYARDLRRDNAVDVVEAREHADSTLEQVAQKLVEIDFDIIDTAYADGATLDEVRELIDVGDALREDATAAKARGDEAATFARSGDALRGRGLPPRLEQSTNADFAWDKLDKAQAAIRRAALEANAYRADAARWLQTGRSNGSLPERRAEVLASVREGVALLLSMDAMRDRAPIGPGNVPPPSRDGMAFVPRTHPAHQLDVEAMPVRNARRSLLLDVAYGDQDRKRARALGRRE
jgi:hypothetical protein